MEYKITVQFNEQLVTYIAESDTLGVTTTGNSSAEAVARLEIKYLELIEMAAKKEIPYPVKETDIHLFQKMEVAMVEEKNLELQMEYDRISEMYSKQKDLLKKILSSTKTDEEKFKLLTKLSEA